jgi:hypothetical protein
MLPEENTHSQHPHNRHKTHITNNNQNNHRPAAAQRLFAWRISLAESLELRGSAMLGVSSSLVLALGSFIRRQLLMPQLVVRLSSRYITFFHGT